MVDLRGQYLRLKEEIDAAMQAVVEGCTFINGPQVKLFSDHLAEYLQVPFVIPCGNGIDALQLALMALDLRSGDEVVIPAFGYVSAVEVVAMMGITPVLVDVDPLTFNINPRKIEEAISRETKAIIAVHLFGQSCDMAPIMKIAETYHLFVIEDNAQSIGAEYTFPDGNKKRTGTIGHIGTTSFFPSKPLACYGDGGALITSDESLAARIRMIASHGQTSKNQHKVIGCNSRLDTIQAAVLDVKLKHLSAFTATRRQVARNYDQAFALCEELIIPRKASFSTHVYHQYTIRLRGGKERRDALQACLKEKGIPSMVYYPLPLQAQEAFKWLVRTPGSMEVSVGLSQSVLSLPIHTELGEDEQQYIIESLREILRVVSL